METIARWIYITDLLNFVAFLRMKGHVFRSTYIPVDVIQRTLDGYLTIG